MWVLLAPFVHTFRISAIILSLSLFMFIPIFFLSPIVTVNCLSNDKNYWELKLRISYNDHRYVIVNVDQFGFRDIRTTLRYAHVSDKTKREKYEQCLTL